MEGLFEANRIAEVSLSKLNSCRSGDVPLRKTLLISKVLNTAQDVATSAHTSLLTGSSHSTSKRCTSKLLASFGPNPDTMDSLPVSLPRTSLPGTVSRPKSPISMEPLTSCDINQDNTSLPDEESMDFENMNSILTSILLDTELEECVEATPSPCLVLQDVSNKVSLNPWSDSGSVSCWEGGLPITDRPMSPGKRNYQQAFRPPFQGSHEDTKRFKSSREGNQLEHVSGFCAYLSSKNLQTAPFITYMFGRGFSEPSNPSLVSGWPDKYEVAESTTTSLSSLHHAAPHNSSPILAF